MTLQEALDEMVAALQQLDAEIPELQVSDYFNPNPTPPSIDIWPGDPFQQGAGFNVRSKRVHWNVRARVANADPQAGQRLLLRLLDVNDPASVEQALATVNVVIGVEGEVGGFRRFSDDQQVDLLSTVWRVEMFV